MSLRRNWPHSRLAVKSHQLGRDVTAKRSQLPSFSTGLNIGQFSVWRAHWCNGHGRISGASNQPLCHCDGGLGSCITAIVNMNSKNNIKHFWARLRLKKAHDWGNCWTTVWKWHWISPLNHSYNTSNKKCNDSSTIGVLTIFQLECYL